MKGYRGGFHLDPAKHPTKTGIDNIRNLEHRFDTMKKIKCIICGHEGSIQGIDSLFDKCLEIFPYFAEAWFNKGNSHKHLLDMKGTLTSFQKVTEWGDQDEDFVNDARELLFHMEASISKDTGLSLESYIQSMDVNLTDRFHACEIENMKKPSSVLITC